MNTENGAKYIYKVENYEGSILDYLRKKHDYSSRIVKSVKKDGELLLNGYPVNFVEGCKSGDTLEIYLRPEHFDAEPEDIPLEILFEDEDILCVNKPPYLVTHPTKSHPGHTLSNAIYNHFTQIGFTGKIHFISRLDMDTSGVVLVAKNKYIHHLMQNTEKYKPFNKYYYAVVKGVLPAKEGESGIIDLPIIRSGDGIKRAVDDDGRDCLTEYTVVKNYGDYGLLRLRLVTGRTHQIRVHLQSVGCPIISDSLYGNLDPLIPRQALHAYEVSFCHPITKETHRIVADFPDDMQKVLKILEEEKIAKGEK